MLMHVKHVLTEVASKSVLVISPSFHTASSKRTITHEGPRLQVGNIARLLLTVLMSQSGVRTLTRATHATHRANNAQNMRALAIVNTQPFGANETVEVHSALVTAAMVVTLATTIANPSVVPILTAA